MSEAVIVLLIVVALHLPASINNDPLNGFPVYPGAALQNASRSFGLDSGGSWVERRYVVGASKNAVEVWYEDKFPGYTANNEGSLTVSWPNAEYGNANLFFNAGSSETTFSIEASDRK